MVALPEQAVVSEPHGQQGIGNHLRKSSIYYDTIMNISKHYLTQSLLLDAGDGPTGGISCRSEIRCLAAA
jgi:hypothetical protein